MSQHQHSFSETFTTCLFIYFLPVLITPIILTVFPLQVCETLIWRPDRTVKRRDYVPIVILLPACGNSTIFIVGKCFFFTYCVTVLTQLAVKPSNPPAAVERGACGQEPLCRGRRHCRVGSGQTRFCLCASLSLSLSRRKRTAGLPFDLHGHAHADVTRDFQVCRC